MSRKSLSVPVGGNGQPLRATAELSLAGTFSRFSRAGGAAVAGIGLLVLAGWAFGIDALRGPIPGLITMKANTALGFLLMGLALWNLHRECGARSRWAGRVGISVALVIGVLSLGQYLLDRNLGIDELLFDDPVDAAMTVDPGRLAPQTALNFVLLGTALLMIDAGSRRRIWLYQSFALAAGAVSLFAVLGYVYGADRLSTVAAFSPMAVHTAIACLVLSAGVLFARPAGGFVRTAVSDSPGGVMVRRLVPGMLIALPVLGWLRLLGEQAGLYGGETGVALMVIAFVACFAVFTLAAARLLNRAEERRRQIDLEHRRLAAIVESSDDAILSKSRDGIITTWNRGAERVYGYSAEEAVGRPITLLVPEPREGEEQEILSHILAGGRIDHYETQRRHKDGRILDVALTVSPVIDAVGDIVGASVIARDITEGKRAEERRRAEERAEAEDRLQRSELRLAESQELAQIGSWDWDIPSDEVVWSDECFRIHDQTPETFAPTYEGWLGLVHEDDRAHARSVVEAAFESREPFSFPYKVVLPDGEVRTIQARGQVVVGAGGAPERMIGTAQDVTERIRAQIRAERLEARLHQSERLESVGQLAGGIAHDFNNLLAVILNYASFVTEELGDDHPARADVEEIRRAADRAAALTQQLLIFSRRERVKAEVLDLNEVVADTEKLLRRTLGEHIELVTAFAPDLSPIEADRGQLEQVLVNLAVNARDAMPDGGSLAVETSNAELAEELVTAGPPVPAGRYARITVTDTGSGMTPDVAQRVFEPFYTTKPKGSGTGLGLATVYGIVAQAGGHIDLYTEPGLGTAFKIYLPATESSVASPAESRGFEARRGRGETVLLVEDEPAVRRLTSRILSRHGYAVIEAEDPAEGLATFQSHEGELDLLLTDVVMPKMSGAELAERIKASQPNLATLYMSGYTDDFVARQGVVTDGVLLLEKPFSSEQLLAAVEAALESRVS